MHSFRWAIIDIETTGLQVTYDAITEISVVIMTEKGIEITWHRLIKPHRRIPDAIATLTGITNEMVQAMPAFGDIAEELAELLAGCILVAHNARFDFGFLKNAFKSSNLSFQIPVLCTIKLFKKFYPGLLSYSLPALAKHFQVSTTNLHRAQGDTEILVQLLQTLQHSFTLAEILEISLSLYQKSSIPSKLMTDVHAFPESAGVYLFYGSHSTMPLYIGKSISLRQRILSHFAGDYLHAKEFTLAQQVERIEIIPTAGELSALLLESELIKEKMPIYNRRLRRKTQIAGFRLQQAQGYNTITIVRESVEDESDLKNYGIYGAFRSMASAKNTLLTLIKKYNLCRKLCHLEYSNSACFSYQLKRCAGACIQKEPAEIYNPRVLEALCEYQELIWPFKGAIALEEKCAKNNLTQYLVFNQWRYLGSVPHEHALSSWQNLLHKQAVYHYDAYKILLNYLKNKSSAVRIIILGE